MAKLQINPEYNWWAILANAGIDPKENDKYTYEDGTLTVPSITQEELNQALANYDHAAFLADMQSVRQRQIAQDPNQRLADIEAAIAALLGGAM